MTKFLLLQSYAGPADVPPITDWTPGDIKAHIDFQHALNDELVAAGEFVDAQGLACRAGQVRDLHRGGCPGGDRRAVR